MMVMTLAALYLHMTTAGGAGAEGKRAVKQLEEASANGQHAVADDITSLKGQVRDLKEEFRLARERQRLVAEEKQRQEEARYGVPPKPAAPAAAPGGARAPAR
jgi:hypothetical protein